MLRVSLAIGTTQILAVKHFAYILSILHAPWRPPWTNRACAIVGSGYVVRSLEAALWAFYRSSSFERGALSAANLGNDGDTTCVIYGQLAGAMYGMSGIPQRWLERLAMRKLIEQMADQLLALSEHLASAAPFHG